MTEPDNENSKRGLTYWLDQLCEITARVVKGEDSFSAMVFSVTGDTVANHLLMADHDEDETGEGRLIRYRAFGRALAEEGPIPDFVIVAELLADGKKRGTMVLNGYSHDGQCAWRGFAVSIGWWGRIQVEETVELIGSDAEYSPAREVYRGIVEAAQDGRF